MIQDQDQHRVSDSGLVVVSAREHPDGSVYRHIHTRDATHEPAFWHARLRVDKRLGEWSQDDVLAGRAPLPYEVVEAENNLLMTTGANQLWTGLSTAGLGTPWSTTNTQLAVGDGSTAPAVGNTDLAASAGSTVNISSSTNASPIVLTTASQSYVAGQVVVVASHTTNTNANGTWEVQAATSTTVTLLNSTGNGVGGATGTVAPINKYRQIANASGSAVVSTNTLTYVATFATANANFQWLEWGTTTGAAATNKQATPPPSLLNRATPGGGLGTKTSAASWTLTVVLSLA
jgi:hypothetical protein